MTDRREFIVDSGKRNMFDVRELWHYRELFFFFTWRDIKIKYKQTLFGFLWAVLQPVIMMVIFTVFLGKMVKVPTQNLPYPVYVFSGLLLWNCFSSGLTTAANGMVNNASIIKKIYFPRLVVPVSAILVAVFDFLIALSVFAIVLIYYKQDVSLNAFWLWPLSVIVLILSVLGPGSWLSALNVKYRDFRYAIPFLMQVLFFLTPVIYPLSVAPNVFVKYALAISPVYAAIELFRMPLTNVPTDPTLLFLSLISAVVLLAYGLFYFKRTEDFFADLA